MRIYADTGQPVPGPFSAQDIARAIAENELPGEEFDGATVGLNLDKPEIEIYLGDGSHYLITVTRTQEAVTDEDEDEE